MYASSAGNHEPDPNRNNLNLHPNNYLALALIVTLTLALTLTLTLAHPQVEEGEPVVMKGTKTFFLEVEAGVRARGSSGVAWG